MVAADMRVFIDPISGRDTGLGSSDDPFATLSRGLSAICRANVTSASIVLRSGTYRGAANTQMATCPVLLNLRMVADDGASPVISIVSNFDPNSTTSSAMLLLSAPVTNLSVSGLAFESCFGPIFAHFDSHPVNVTLSDCRFNATAGAAFSSFSNANLSVVRTVISNSVSGYNTSPLTVFGGVLSVWSSSFLFNGNASSDTVTGGAINAAGDSMTIADSYFIGNTAGLGGAVSGGGVVVVVNSLVPLVSALV